jgi:hypothetical protein
MVGNWGKLHKEEVRNLYSSRSIFRMIMSREYYAVKACSKHGKGRIACKILVGKPEGKRPLGRLIDG